VLADFPDFRDPRGVRHPLSAVLLLSCVAMLCGARGESAIAEWAANYGETWRAPLGFTRSDGPSQSTVQRIFTGLDCTLLESRLGEWAVQVIAHAPAPLMRRCRSRRWRLTARRCAAVQSAVRRTHIC
jgi:hypothetical protein